MRLFDFLSTDAEEPVSRRDVLNQLKATGLCMAAASMPLALLGRSQPASAQSTGAIVDVLNYALTLEYLEDSYYQQGLDADGLIPADGSRAVYGQISKHETAHVQLLGDTIQNLGGTPVSFSDSDFDFTAGGSFDPFNDYSTFLLLSQAFEDTGVRAYKGQAPTLAGNDLLTAALQIHSVEARHAAEVRRLRAVQGVSLKPWITGAQSGGAPQAIYAGEDNQTQAGIDQRSLGNGEYTFAEVTEAYDEPLTRDAVAGESGIVLPFFA